MEHHSDLKHAGLRRLLLGCLSLILLLTLALPAFAHEVPDLTKKGSITLTMRCEGEIVTGGSMTLYRVGDIAEDDGDYFFALTSFFAPTGVSLADPTDPAVALALQTYARDNGAVGVKRIINDEGQAIYSDLEPGLYLLSQETPSKGYEPAAPFLISVPMNEDGHYVYDVSALPKVALVPEPTTEPPTVPNTPLAKTGQSVIPIYVLASIGVVLVLAGWLMTQRRSGDDSDAPETPETPETPASPDAAPEAEAPAEAPETAEAPDAPDAAETPDASDAPDEPTDQA